MAFWPRDERKESKESSTKYQPVEDKRNYPYLEPGLTGAATLSPENLAWSFLSNPFPPGRGQWTTTFALSLLLYHVDVIERRLRCREFLQIFPPTRAIPPDLSEKTSIKRRAEQGVSKASI